MKEVVTTENTRARLGQPRGWKSTTRPKNLDCSSQEAECAKEVVPIAIVYLRKSTVAASRN
jgi:hypothetical protein